MISKNISISAIVSIVFAITSAFTTTKSSTLIVIANHLHRTPMGIGLDITTQEQSYPGSTQGDRADNYQNGAPGNPSYPAHCMSSDLICFIAIQDGFSIIIRLGSFD